MISLVGFSSLCFSTLFSFYFVPKSIINLKTKYFYVILRFSTLLICVSFLSLMTSYITSDFSNFNVFQNSHSDKPLIYKISGTWEIMKIHLNVA